MQKNKQKSKKNQYDFCFSIVKYLYNFQNTKIIKQIVDNYIIFDKKNYNITFNLRNKFIK